MRLTGVQRQGYSLQGPRNAPTKTHCTKGKRCFKATVIDLSRRSFIPYQIALSDLPDFESLFKSAFRYELFNELAPDLLMHHPDHAVTLCTQQRAQVRAVLPGDAGDERGCQGSGSR